MFSVLRAGVSRQACLGVRNMSRSVRSILDDDSTPVDLSEDNDAVDGIRSPSHRRKPPTEPTPAAWQAHRASLKEAFPDGWNPPRKLSREAMDGLRQLHRVDPETFTTPVLAERFRISPEGVRRILKSRWTPPPQRRAELLKREAESKLQYRQLSALRERMEARQVLQSREDIRAARYGELEFQDGEDDEETESAHVRGIHSRDRLAFE
ncbi:hypothetical protein C8F04DRAFT_385643 [Mycena alexandri]|uniref:Required for respiratory growth protein 9, mitochondrial n=1 Tax=Mycena alexandri TaxID=1745969 RepID=A0AAD6T513_9AGAR|nr:hypothetical protein C8F04DRAFT_385643 [Mycena alexandri]